MKKIFITSFLGLALLYPCAAQQVVEQAFFWPKKSPTGVIRTMATETAEDWWYDVTKIPATHPAYSEERPYVAVGYSTYDDEADPAPPAPYYYFDVFEDEPCVFATGSWYIEQCELETNGQYHGIGAFVTLGFVNMADPSITNRLTYHYGLGELYSVIPTSDGGFLASGTMLNTLIPNNTLQADPHIPNHLKGLSIPYQSEPGQQDYFTDQTCSGVTPGNLGRACLMKTDAEGKLEWVSQYGLLPFEATDNGLRPWRARGKIFDLREIDGAYYFVGYQQNGLANTINDIFSDQAFLGKVDTDGRVIWINPICGLDGIQRTGAWGITVNDDDIYICGETTTGTYPNWLEFKGFVTKYNTDGNCQWNEPLWIHNDLTQAMRCRDISVLQNGNLCIGWVSECNNAVIEAAGGECLNSFVSVIEDAGTEGIELFRTPLGATRAYDLIAGVAVTALDDGGFTAVGMKKTYHVWWPDIDVDNDGILDFEFSDCNTSYSTYYVDSYVAKFDQSAKMQWCTTFDAVSPSPSPSATNSFAGVPWDQQNLISWLSNPNTYQHDIRREECMYSITTDVEGRIMIAGNNSANLDDSYIAVVEHTCDLLLNFHLIQRIDRANPLDGKVNGIDEYVAATITTGREVGNTNDIAAFRVENEATLSLRAGESIKMRPGTTIARGTTVTATIDPGHQCTPGAVHALED